MHKPKNIPKNPGVYIFKNLKQKPLYVGKAGNLKKRLAFYFSHSPKSSKMARLLIEAKKLQIIETDSEIEALIKEAELIKKHLPKYNVLMRDDKNYFYIGITKKQFPRIFITHQPTLHNQQPTTNNQQPKKYVGPFTDGNALKTTLKLLRRIFPYCTCKELHKRPCLNAEIGRCPGFCCLTLTNNQQLTTNNVRNYKNNIENIITVLNGKKKGLLSKLKREMRETSKNQEFEKAAILRDKIWGLENIFEHRRILVRHPEQSEGSQKILRSAQNDEVEKRLQKLLKTNKAIVRIEGYDISNISGTEATGSMVVFVKKTNGTYAPDKNQYRKFKIKTVHKISDVDMLAEVIKRRFNHPEWPYPDLIVVDGGKPQLSAALAALADSRRQNADSRRNSPRASFLNPLLSASSPRKSAAITVALAKQNEELYIENRRLPIRLKQQPKEILHLFQRIRDESHRFAKKYHHKLREKKYKNG